jgi:flavin reductase (DIM6/NTAB) family NADH-FMN oxidoreductase RutF
MTGMSAVVQAREEVSEDARRALRRVLGTFGTGVTVVTTRHPDGMLVGVTANSFTSVSLDPPIVAWSLQTRSPSLEAFRRSGGFAINVLSIEQQALSAQFSRPAADKFHGVAWRPGLNGLPLLEDCVATLECTVVQSHEVGDHVMFFGRVERHSCHDAQDPLIYCRGRYAQAVSLSTF